MLNYSGAISLSDLNQIGYKDACKIYKGLLKLAESTQKNKP